LKDQQITTKEKAHAALLDIAGKSLDAEEEHLFNALQDLLATNEARLETTMNERLETLETFFQGLRLEEGEQRSPSALLSELSSLLHMPLKLDNAQQKWLREDPDKAADIVHDMVEESLREQAVTRLVGALERRLDTELAAALSASDLAKEKWQVIGERLTAAVNAEFAGRRERLIGDGDGVIAKELDEALSKVQGEVNQAVLLNALISMPESRVAAFDKKTHKQVVQRKRRLSLNHYAAQFIAGMKAEEITSRVLKHLQNAQKATQTIWGMGAWDQLSARPASEINEAGRGLLQSALGKETFESLNGNPLSSLPDETKQKAIQGLGRRALSESYRQLLLRVISELWVDYLTRMEALRISIRLEAYAQRDPLVEYKAAAFKMFQDLFADMRSSLVNRMFVFQPGPVGATARAAAQVQASGGNGVPADAEPEKEPTTPGGGEAEGAEGGGKRRRRRRKAQ
jgi:preprotein translocase subunit SecA